MSTTTALVEDHVYEYINTITCKDHMHLHIIFFYNDVFGDNPVRY